MDIKEIINKRYAMPDASLDKLQRCLTEVSYPKGFRVLERGKVEKNIFSSRKALSAHILQWTERKLPLVWQRGSDYCLLERLCERRARI